MKKNGVYLLIVVIICAGFFFAGMKYGEKKSAVSLGRVNISGAGSSAGQGNGGRNGNGFARGNGARVGGGFIGGEILSKDDKTITVKLRDGGSKIILFSDSTKIAKEADGSVSDLETGKMITVTGNANSDGTISAQSIQIRPIFNDVGTQGRGATSTDSVTK